MTGRWAFDRCRRCWRDRARAAAFRFDPTGRLRRRANYGRRHNVWLAEQRCLAGHTWWSSHPTSVEWARRRIRRMTDGAGSGD